MTIGNPVGQFWIRSPGIGELVWVELPPRAPGEVTVRTLFSGISRGTESRVFRGEVPPSQYRAMRAPFQEGDFPGPVKYGYLNVGEVVEAPPEWEEALLGRAVFSLYPHQERFSVPAEAVTRLPTGVPPGRAVLAGNMETAVNALWDARPAVGDRVVVVGGGVVGLLVAWLARQVPGTRVTVVDPDPHREVAAAGLGLHWSPRPPDGSRADLVIHASGSPQGLADALELAGEEATVLELSWFGDLPVPLPLGEAFHSRRLTIRSSQVGRIPPDRTPRWGHGQRMVLALELLREPALEVLISGESPFLQLPEVMEHLSRSPSASLCHRIRYGAG